MKRGDDDAPSGTSPSSRLLGRVGAHWRSISAGSAGPRRDLVYLTADRGIRALASFVVAGMVARHLGVSAFGALNYALALMAIGGTVVQLGLDGLVVREFVRRPQDQATIAGALIALRFIAALVVGALLWAGPTLLPDSGTDDRLIKIAVLGVFAPVLGLPALWLQARNQSWLAVRWGFAVFGCGLIVRLVLIHDNAGVHAFAWVAAWELLAGGAILAVPMWQNGGRLRLRETWRAALPLLREGWPLFVSSLAVVAYMRADMVMLQHLAGAEAVGIYAAATRLSEAAYGLPMLIGVAVLATLTHAHDDPARFKPAVFRYFRFSAAVAYVVVLPVGILAPWVLELVFGSSFAGAGVVSQVHLVSVVFVFMGVARGQVLIVLGQTRFAMISTLVGLATNIAANVLLIPTWGALGAAWATVLAQMVAAVATTLVYRPSRDIGLLQWKALLSPRMEMRLNG